jgi:hypothetical protein
LAPYLFPKRAMAWSAKVCCGPWHRAGHLTTPEGRKAQLADWANKRRRISCTEAADLTGLSVPYVGKVLARLEEEGILQPGREGKAGRGFYYVPSTPPMNHAHPDCRHADRA